MGWRTAINILVIQILMVIAVWLPIVLTRLHPPYTSGMNIPQSILGGAYRLVFQCFTLPVFALICWVLVRSWWELRRSLDQHFPDNFVLVACCVTPIVFFAALFLHPSKPSHVLFALPFVLILAVRRSAGLLITWTFATVVGFFVTIDIFNQRQLGRPHLVAGSYFDAIYPKPFYKGAYLKKVLQYCDGSPTAVIADLWRWDIEYHIQHGTVAAKEQVHDDVPVFYLASAASRWSASPVEDSPWRARSIEQRPLPPEDCVLLPRDAALHSDLISELAAHGYNFKMDSTLYRTLFARYDVMTAIAMKGQIGDIPVELFPVTAPWR